MRISATHDSIRPIVGDGIDFPARSGPTDALGPYSVYAISASQYSPVPIVMATARALPPLRFRAIGSTGGMEWAGNHCGPLGIGSVIRSQPGRGSRIGTACHAEPDSTQYRLGATFNGSLAGLSQRLLHDRRVTETDAALSEPVGPEAFDEGQQYLAV